MALGLIVNSGRVLTAKLLLGQAMEGLTHCAIGDGDDTFTDPMNPPQPDPIQQKIFQFMPVMFTFIMAPFAVGLLIYWTWSNVLTILQQYVIMRRFKVDNPIDQIIAKITGKPREVG